MRLLFGVVAVLALAGCESDGRPSKAMGAALKGFSRGFGDGSAGAPPASSTALRARPLEAPAQPVPNQPLGGQAFFTGRAKQVQTVSGAQAWECQYNYAGQTFSLLFDSYCPSSASVR